MEHGWRESRLPSLTRVPLCLVTVGVSRVSWEFRYLDKPRWRAVSRLNGKDNNYHLNIKLRVGKFLFIDVADYKSFNSSSHFVFLVTPLLSLFLL